jgi:Spy/CpxP family protein refolding chaperone
MLEAQEGKVKEVTKEMNDLVDEIAKKKAELTKGHLQCVVEVQNILTKEQRMKVGEIIGASKHKEEAKESKKKI